ncbi:MAG: FHA domain-containing protein [Anaerolineae bacterium]|nr:FHA domain-containing protein [Anaerolineae bacterium]RLC61418.1 MAG: transcriptional regulator [Chloroflexota bacterium]
MSERVPYLEDTAGQHFPLAGPVITLGRSRNCDVYVPDKRASRRHAEIRWDGETATLHDLGSANGTFLDGRRITTPQTLRDGDEIAVASAVFTFRDPEATFRITEFPLLVVDQATGEIWVNRKPITLSPKEQTLFDLLYRNTGRICSKQEIAEVVWPEYRAEVYDYQIESLVKRLREKLEPDPRHPVLILTVRGRGYKLIANA